MANTVPDTTDFTVAALSVAWEIVRETYNNGGQMNGTGDAGSKTLTNELVRIYNAILSRKPIEG